MHKGGWRPFWAALWAALLVLLPLVGGTVLLTRRMLHTQLLAQTAEPQQGVPITLPKEDDRMMVLLCTAGEQPGFLLLYLNAPQNVCGLLAVPGELTVPFGDGEASLTRCYAAAGPARCRQALLETLARNEGKIVTVDALCEALWGDNPFGYENSLNAHVRRIREKIEADPSKPVSLITIKGLGYKLITRK